MTRRKVLILSMGVVFLTGVALAADAIPNWAAPAVWTPPRPDGLHAMSDVTNPLPFVGVSPCRVADTRGNGFAGQYGPPSIGANTTRTFTIAGQCGIPASAKAVSFNVAALDVGGTGDLRVFPAGGGVPLVSTLNYNANTPNIANAAVVSLGTGGAITVQADAAAIDLIIDVNGYYPADINAGEFFEVTGNVGTGVGVIEGFNGSTAASAFGVLGQINSTSPGGSSAGVRGINNGTFVEGIGVWGSHASAGVGVLGTTVGGFGVVGITNATGGGTAVTGESNGGEGVLGTSANTAGEHFGVIGQCLSFANGSAGVSGTDASGYDPLGVIVAGVKGSSQNAVGVYGISRFLGVEGALFNGSDAFAAFGLLGTTFGTAADTTTGPWAVFAGGTFGATGAKHFVEPDPREPNGVILYSSLEGREVGTYFRGTARTSGGSAVIEIPEDFGIVTDENGLTVQLTPVGAFSQMYVESQDLNQIVVHSSRDVTFHYLVQGVRRAFKDFKPLAKGYEFMPRSADERMPFYLTEEARRRLIANGTYNADGTVNMTTAERAGWTKIWADRKAEEEATAKKAREAAANQFQFQH